MPGQIFDIADLKARLAKGAQLVDVLPAEDFELDHIPGAINIPLREINTKTLSKLSKDRPVIVYCYDFA